MVFHRSLSDTKSPQVSRIPLYIPAVLNNIIVWVVSTGPSNSESSCHFNNSLMTEPKAPLKSGIIVTFMFHNLFNSLARSMCLSLFLLSYSCILWSAGTEKSTILKIIFFLLIIIRSGLLAYIR